MEKNEIMTDENQLSSEEIKKLRDLIDTEEIKKLRLKYSYHMDARELDELMDVFADGAVCGYGPYGDWEGKETIYNNYKETFKDTINTPFISMHVNTNHLVEITGPDTAKGRVYLLDVITKNMDGSDIEEGEFFASLGQWLLWMIQLTVAAVFAFISLRFSLEQN